MSEEGAGSACTRAPLLSCERGASIVEYLAILGLVAIAALGAYHALGESIAGATSAAKRQIAMISSESTAAASSAEPGCASGACLGESCFVAGTLVATPSGPRPIEAIREGDLVSSADDVSGLPSIRTVVETYTRRAPELTELHLRAEDGASETLRTTPEHPFRVAGRGWVPCRGRCSPRTS